ncbi:hypothetical protein A3I27_00035 [Candidatus Giovannonibacteria bacterium RIFCSPLOWO2_02_FULL_43_11b]|uniref:CDP-alcohol phosphatidyltransferase n=1 Tax=Candidatus Giovannonibacteria bacterium RIFCSPHIGHO2_12_FULL_43_15 TaxID=1798341 RepID=A0A1F5WNH9_9BACT|nr:MAG: hypothetical protein A2739_00405 [Candidatus Giovannonibacteria bacterium RIFCSPHIGHO2_01_FULL_43_100]OGF67566.1 MAG: hypothetical protein A3B97_00685 [Candidatus Giovannonibacteria bacterium RIFCSPHIGHO2_02_FULL_43_32]OGF77239.1 MAG: hypothetical protein A3F23_03155 [Candidatus Giovannonibacteria bacterium RIFCSPHIGHO2_12_FULL_43_15]OGF79066.1 MAG: hypothetical protein A3A15_03665 [Candidatus Giovannonibacteria bacterium RIFCSPLOWO2_01_FULL_43_60]OGF90645.1 MAG: hypothetical protein A3
MPFSIGVFGLAAVAGYFLLPIFLSKEVVRAYLARTTNSEAEWRDYLLRPVTDFLDTRFHFISPNVISLIGFALVGFLAYLFSVKADYLLIFAVTLLAGFTDMLDGSLARNAKRVTKTGVILDVARDFILVLVLSFYLISYQFLAANLFFWFLVGYIFLGLIRNLEFKFASGKFSLDEDYKFVLDRMRLFIYIVGILILILTPLSESFRTLGETLIISSIVMTWISVLFHSAHLKILRDERVKV